MAALLSPRRSDSDLALRATVAQTQRPSRRDDATPPPAAGWLLAAVGGGLAVSLIGWIILCGLVVLGWLASAPGSFSGAMRVGTQLWLLANGASGRLGTTTVTLVPYGATLLFALLASRFAAFAGRQSTKADAAATAPASPSTWRRWGAITGLLVLAYAVPVLVAKLLVGVPGARISSLAGVGAVLAFGAAWGSRRGLGYSPTAAWPRWCRAVLRGVLGAQLALAAAGAGALGTGLVVHINRVSELTNGLHAGLAGGLALWLAQLVWLPNAVVWAASYVLGAGFSLGSGTVVSPVATQLGLLPSVPLFGALPRPQTGDSTALWWLAAGVLAGGVAAWLALRAQPDARWDVSTLVGGLAGAASGLVFVGIASVSGGDLGTSRLAGLGPRLLPLLTLSGSTLGLSGLLFGLIVGLARLMRARRRRRRVAEAASSPGDSASG